MFFLIYAKELSGNAGEDIRVGKEEARKMVHFIHQMHLT